MKLKKILAMGVCLCIYIGTIVPVSAGYGQEYSLGSRGWKMRVDRPHNYTVKESKHHVHVWKSPKGGNEWSEAVDGGNSHGGNLDDVKSGQKVPEDVKGGARNHPETERAREEERERQAEFRKKEKALRLKTWILQNQDTIRESLRTGITTTITIGTVTVGVAELLEYISILGLCII